MQHSGAIFTTCAKLHLSAQVMRHQLHSIANTEHRDSEGKDFWVEMWCAFVVNTRGTARENKPVRFQPGDFSCRCVQSNNFLIHLQPPHEPTVDLHFLLTVIAIEDFQLHLSG